MSGVFGIFFPDGKPVDRDRLSKMALELTPRGPDGAWLWNRDHVGIGHTLFRTAQHNGRKPFPLEIAEAHLVIAADMRLDNRYELAAQVGLADVPTDELHDGELILAAYQIWGESCFEKLAGDFAVAIWDERRRKLILARDHMGVKPLYYFSSQAVLIFASEIKAILCLPDVPRKLNERRVADYLNSEYHDLAATFYQDIYRLPPAHILIANGNGIQLRRYWELDASAETRFESNAEYEAAFRGIFAQAVRCRLGTAGETAVALSGGLDSSAIASTAQRCRQIQDESPLHTFSAVFQEFSPEYRRRLDESHQIKAVADHCGIRTFTIQAGQVSPLADHELLFRFQDEPYFAPHLAIHWAVYQAVAKNGIRVFLEGFDGDITVSHGFERLTELFFRLHWRQLQRELDELKKHGLLQSNRKAILWRYGLRPAIPDSLRSSLKTLKQSTKAYPSLIRPEFAQRAQSRMGDTRFIKTEKQNPRNARGIHKSYLTSPLIPLALELLDKVAVAAGIELRYPYFDRRFVEFCLALPAEQKLSNGWTRSIQRRAMTGLLPDEIRWRTDKADFGLYFSHNLLASDKDCLERTIFKENTVIEPFIDIAALQRTYLRYRDVKDKNLDDAEQVYGAVLLAEWLKYTGLS